MNKPKNINITDVYKILVDDSIITGNSNSKILFRSNRWDKDKRRCIERDFILHLDRFDIENLACACWKLINDAQRDIDDIKNQMRGQNDD